MLSFVPAAFASTGAVWTTDDTCGGVNINLFELKADVYLNGGPQGGGGGLPDGNYYVQVTDPSGSVVLGKTVGATAIVSGGQFVQCYQLIDILYTGSSNFVAKGYDDTPNTGGEYKVWASKEPDFSGGTNKTDNFKVEEGNTGGGGDEQGSISGVKFLDLNLDTEFVDEDGIAGWQIELWQYTGEGTPSTCDGTDWSLVDTTSTDGDGYYYFAVDLLNYYKVVEVFPNDSECGDWEATTDTCHIVNLTAEPYTAENQNFGNVCFNTGGLTMGYWKNHSGEAKGPKADSRYDDTYNSLPIDLGSCLTVDDPKEAYDIFTAAKANDTGKKMLAAQLLAAELNLIKFSSCEYGDAVYAGNIEDFEGWPVTQIVEAAEALLCDENAEKPEVVKMIEVLDQLNNNGEGSRVLVNPKIGRAHV